MVVTVKREKVHTRSNRSQVEKRDNNFETRQTKPPNCNNNNNNNSEEGDVAQRRVLRSRYLNVKNRISNERDDISKKDSDNFNAIFEEVEFLHQQVQKPREQVADAEPLLDIASTLVSSVKAHSNEGITPSDFISCLLKDFGKRGGPSNNLDEERNSVRWRDIGCAVSNVFPSAFGCLTMVGPLDTELKQRKPVHRKRTKLTEQARPEELDSGEEEKTDTDKNMATMFGILRKNRNVRLENLILNRNSFAQTVENLFALSFLVKDGRAEIEVDEKGCDFVVPKNAPAANSVLSGEVSFSHFVFRFDFKDWKLMLSSVKVGNELMPHRIDSEDANKSQPASASEDARTQPPTTPIRKFCRNRGLVLQEQTLVEDSPGKTAAVRRGKRKLIA
ncbi:hypothetical protein LIER_34534 [Lithospermum erythrorhizon]|uniref:Non-structural maintenance of chromosomes element 4 n=1 Tax=Lithospermum erythrorhizon TaxID=34254 RepID=A0AAV3S3V6_LITER